MSSCRWKDISQVLTAVSTIGRDYIITDSKYKPNKMESAVMSDKMRLGTELYDISTDASQQNNIAVQLPEKSSSNA
jgi:hypothetical protein